MFYININILRHYSNLHKLYCDFSKICFLLFNLVKRFFSAFSFLQFLNLCKFQGAKNNNNFDTTSEIMFLALTPPPRQSKKSKICSQQTIYIFFFQKMLIGVKNRKKNRFSWSKVIIYELLVSF